MTHVWNWSHGSTDHAIYYTYLPWSWQALAAPNSPDRERNVAGGLDSLAALLEEHCNAKRFLPLPLCSWKNAFFDDRSLELCGKFIRGDTH